MSNISLLWTTDAGGAWMAMLIDATIKGTVILLLAGLATWLLRAAPAAMRHLVWLLAVASLLLLPVLSVTVPTWQVLPVWMSPERVISTPPAAATAAQPVAVTVGPDEPGLAAAGESAVATSGRPTELAVHSATPAAVLAAPDVVAGPEPAGTVPPAMPTQLSVRAIVVLVWLAGTAAVLGRTMLGVLSLGLLGWRARLSDCRVWAGMLGQVSQDLGLKRRVALLESNHRAMPMVWGIWRPKLLVPAESGTWSTERRRVVLLHELAHVKRWDCLWQMVVQVACAVYWFHPLVWVVRRSMQAECERACDDLVLEAGSKPSDYASHLLEIASGLHAERLSGVAAIAMARPSRLEGRLLAILDVKRSRSALTWGVVLAGIVLLGSVVVPVAMLKAGTEPAMKVEANSPSATQPAAD